MTDLFVRVRQYIDDDVEPTDLPAVLAAAERGEAAAREDLAERFKGPLQFGTAGLRGLMGGGPFRMNRATVLRATDGLVRYLINTIADARERGLVVGRDARHHSDDFQADVAGVAAAHGMRVYWLEGPTPTPLTAFGVLKLNAAAGVVVTASHNPPAYNGYKVFWGNGAQIIPPHDEGIAAAIDAAPGARHVPRDEPVVGEGRIEDVSSLADDYVEALDAVHFAPAVNVGALKVAYTAMHGVGAALFRRVLARRGPVKLFEVAEQIEPDGDFPTVAFPNPEEPGALDLALAVGHRHACDVVVAHDPDADRLGVAVRDGDQFRVLTGNEIGVLLAAHILKHTEGADRLVVTTLVSSRQLKQMAETTKVHFAETLTGFKWIANEALAREANGQRFVFGYEEALGYCCGAVVRDKDGISAGLVLVEMAAEFHSRGLTLLDALREIRSANGTYLTKSASVTFADDAARIRRAMIQLRRSEAETWAGMRIVGHTDLAEAEDPQRRSNVLLFDLDGGRVAARPSGTEPKIKFYLEVYESGDVEAALIRGETRLSALLTAVCEEAGLVAPSA